MVIDERSPNWDARVANQIAKEKWGGLKGCFDAHKWSEKETDMMIALLPRIVECYGSVENFAAEHGQRDRY